MPLSKFGITLMIFTILNIGLCGYAAQDAANSGRNKVQLQNNELTARDQGNSKVDVEITRTIRQKVIANKTLSRTAKNIKIITIGGNVTLKGPIASQAEKESLFMIATDVAGKNHVQDELEIINQ